jgi:hypothetical protein
MISSTELTFVIPTFRLKEHRLKNLKFIVPYILQTGCKIILAEQIRVSDKSSYEELLEGWKNHPQIVYVPCIIDDDKIHKSKLINDAVKNFVDTKYVWVNDVDFYTKFADVVKCLPEEKFIQPYSAGKKLSESDTYRLLSGQSVKISYEEDAEYISLYGALAFVFDKEEFLKIGSMNEGFVGWGGEDEELKNRVHKMGYEPTVIQKKGIHLWHPIQISEESINASKIENPDMAVVTCYFNWCGYSNTTRNLHRFIRQTKRENIPLFGVELSLTDSFETCGMENWKRIKVKKENVCFQKEACINLAVSEVVPSKYTKIAWIDCDLHFTDKNWYSKSSTALNKFKVVQLYSIGVDTDEYGRMIKKTPGAVFSYFSIPENQRVDWINNAGAIGYPGGAWAARREMWNHGGLYPYRILGGGDTAFALAILKPKMGWPSNELYVNRHNLWKKKLSNYVSGSVFYIENEFIHEWHGNKTNRKYSDRYALLNKLDVSHVALDSTGLVCNFGDRSINDRILGYFKSREEDSDHREIVKNSTVVYTCISGEYDELREIESVEPGIDYICYTNKQLQSKTWKIKPIPSFISSLSATKQARCIKILPHLFVSEYTTSVWVDGNIQVIGGINSFIQKNLRGYFAIPKHPHRICLHEEAAAVISLGKDCPNIVNKQVSVYDSNGYPKNFGMVQSNVIIRLHNDTRCITISNDWWTEVRRYSKRDQLSFNYVIWKKNVNIDILNPNLIVGENFQQWSHINKGNKKVVLPVGYGDLKNYINGETV